MIRGRTCMRHRREAVRVRWVLHVMTEMPVQRVKPIMQVVNVLEEVQLPVMIIIPVQLTHVIQAQDVSIHQELPEHPADQVISVMVSEVVWIV